MESNKFSQRIRELRKEYKMTQTDLANIVGITPTGVSYWESGTIPNAKTLHQLSQYFGVTIDYLLGREGKKEQNVGKVLLLRNIDNIDNREKEKLSSLIENTIDMVLTEKPRFALAKNKASEILMLQEDIEFPINAKNIKFNDRIILIFSYKEYSEKTGINEKDLLIKELNEDAFTQINVRPKVDLILYNSEISSEARINWSIAHELGHIALGHNKQTDIYEVEANTFASQLLLPQCVLKYLLKNGAQVTVDYLVNKFGLSKEASSKYLVNMRNNIDKEYSTEFDDIILVKFLPYISSDLSNDSYFDELENNRNKPY